MYVEYQVNGQVGLSYLSLQEEHKRAMASTVPRKMTEESAIMAISVAPI